MVLGVQDIHQFGEMCMMCGSLPGLDSEPLCGWAPAPEVVKISGVCVKKGGLGGGLLV